MPSLESVRSFPTPEPTPSISIAFSPHKSAYSYVVGETTVFPSGTFYANTGEAITFTATIEMNAVDRWIVGYRWDFGDGGKGYDNPATHTYVQANVQMQASLTITDNKGVEWTARKSMYLKEPANKTLAFVERAQTLGATYILAPKNQFNSLVNQGSASVPDASLHDNAVLKELGLLVGGSSVELDGNLDSILTSFSPFIGGQGNSQTFVGVASRRNNSAQHTLFGGNGSSPPSLTLANGSQNVIWQASNEGHTWVAAWPGNEQTVVWALVVSRPAPKGEEEFGETCELYINGVSKGSKVVDSYNSPGNLYIGTTKSTFVSSWNGRQLPFAVFSKALTSSEILSLYNATL